MAGGDVDTATKITAIKQHLFPADSSDPHRAALDSILGVIDRARDFERENGVGSFLNIQHPFVRASIEGFENTYGKGMLENAAKASTSRELFNLH
jgi:hypothetical protein